MPAWFARARQRLVTRRLMPRVARLLPRLGDTERVALEAGSVGWDGELFSGAARLGGVIRVPRPAAIGCGAGVPVGPGRGAVREPRRLADHAGRRSSRGDVGVPAPRALLRPDHPRGLRRARLLGTGARGGDPEAREPQPDRRGDGDGAELARPGGAPASLRHRRAARLLPAAPRARAGDPVLRADEPRGGQRRRRDAERGDRLPRQVARRGGARDPPALAQALHHARADRDVDRARVPAARPRSHARRTRPISASPAR